MIAPDTGRSVPAFNFAHAGGGGRDARINSADEFVKTIQKLSCPKRLEQQPVK